MREKKLGMMHKHEWLREWFKIWRYSPSRSVLRLGKAHRGELPGRRTAQGGGPIHEPGSAAQEAVSRPGTSDEG